MDKPGSQPSIGDVEAMDETGSQPNLDGSSCDTNDTTPAQELQLFGKLALPSVIIQIFVLLPGVQTAMAVGR